MQSYYLFIQNDSLINYKVVNKFRYCGVIMSNKITAKHILVEKKSLAEEIIEKINGGALFEEMAREYSTCPSKKKGGNLGEFGRGQMVKEFEIEAFKLQKGQMTQVPVKTKFGYHIIKRVK